jgi:hypothetical protein
MRPTKKDRAVLDIDFQRPTSTSRNKHRAPSNPGWRCQVEGCTCTVRHNSWGRLCDRHRANDIRYGHPQQRPLRSAELASYLRSIARVRARNKGTNWDAVEARWGVVVDVARRIEDEARAGGGVYIRPRRQAANIILGIAENVAVSRIVDIICACYLIEELDNRRFASDRGFRSTMLHMLRRESKSGRVFHAKDGGRLHASYRVLSKRVRDTAVDWIVEALGVVGVHIAQQERNRMDANRVSESQFKVALASIS